MRESQFRAGGAWMTFFAFMLLILLKPAGAQEQLARLSTEKG